MENWFNEEFVNYVQSKWHVGKKSVDKLTTWRREVKV